MEEGIHHEQYVHLGIGSPGKVEVFHLSFL